jgi:hypothetical protein
MRTTLDLPEDALEAVRRLAAERSISNGKAAAELIRRGVNADVPTRWENGLLVFDPGPEGAVTVEHVMKLKDDLEGQSW